MRKVELSAVTHVVPREVYPSYFHLLIPNAFVVVSRIGCLGVTGVLSDIFTVLQ